MARKSEEPIEKRKISLYLGDFDALGEILAIRKISPSTFIRALVRKKLRELQAAAADTAQPVHIGDIDDLLGDITSDGSEA